MESDLEDGEVVEADEGTVIQASSLFELNVLLNTGIGLAMYQFILKMHASVCLLLVASWGLCNSYIKPPPTTKQME